jgi:lipopolysaccharide export LptBFGC system permease protein LptF
MLTLVKIPRSHRSAAATAALIADYTAYDHQRSYRRQYIRAFGGIAVIVFFGAMFRFEPRREGLIAALLFALPPAILGAVEAYHWHRLTRRLKAIHADIQQAAA